MDTPKVLTFEVVDDLAFGATGNGQQQRDYRIAPRQIGPLVEFALLTEQGSVGSSNGVAKSGALWSLLTSPARNTVIELGDGTGFMRLGGSDIAATELTRLSIVAKKAALKVGFGDRPAGQLSAALSELLSNIVEHSEAAETGLVGYQALDGHFSFVVADQGIGALQSLRSNPRFAQLATDREALPMVLQDGCSRMSDPVRGRGFNGIFEGLANHSGALRFRSGDAAVLIDGRNPTAIRPTVKKRPRLRGFLASISCAP